MSLLVILSGPSGVGKDTLLDAWKQINPDVERVVAYTTRSPRKGERPGIDYHFVDSATFEGMAERGEFLEFKNVHGNYYGTPLLDMERMLAEGKVAVLKIDVQGALSAMELRPDAITIFVRPPSWEELERRIRDRGLDTPEVMQKRLQNAKNELLLADKYRYQIVNDNVTSAAARLQECLESARVA